MAIWVRQIGCTALLLVCLFGTPGVAQQASPDLQQEIEALKQGQQAIQKELQEIKQLLQARQRRRPVAPDVKGQVFTLRDRPVKGEPTAMLTLIEYTDYQWPYCARHVRETYPQLETAYINTGQLKYTVIDFPLESIHPLAFKASEATHCAREQDRYWEMHDRLFAHQRQLTPWKAHAEALGLDVTAFEACLSSGKYAEQIRQGMAEARKIGATGTPSFILARTDPNDPTKVKGLSFMRGAQPFTAFKSQIDQALNAEK